MKKPKKPIIGCVQGRRGLIDLVGINIWAGSEDKVFIDGIAGNGRTISGGFLSLDSKAVETALTQWLEDRGFIIYPPARLAAAPEAIAEDAPHKTYFVRVRIIEESTHQVSVEARNKSEANQKALNNEGEYMFGTDKGGYTNAIIGVEEEETEEEDEETT